MCAPSSVGAANLRRILPKCGVQQRTLSWPGVFTSACAEHGHNSRREERSEWDEGMSGRGEGEEGRDTGGQGTAEEAIRCMREEDKSGKEWDEEDEGEGEKKKPEKEEDEKRKGPLFSKEDGTNPFILPRPSISSSPFDPSIIYPPKRINGECQCKCPRPSSICAVVLVLTLQLFSRRRLGSRKGFHPPGVWMDHPYCPVPSRHLSLSHNECKFVEYANTPPSPPNAMIRCAVHFPQLTFSVLPLAMNAVFYIFRLNGGICLSVHRNLCCPRRPPFNEVNL
ncbi:hypothetical protein niasHS_014689 [Heterodera schachtii]|uniref:Uncharacterized protein n=1 Tax=Heterodera schachtii TaxID=97005 RepID=A0ABD2IFC3_HETSC